MLKRCQGFLRVIWALLLIGPLVPVAGAAGTELVAYREYLRPDPFGGVVAQDAAASQKSPAWLRAGARFEQPGGHCRAG